MVAVVADFKDRGVKFIFIIITITIIVVIIIIIIIVMFDCRLISVLRGDFGLWAAALSNSAEATTDCRWFDWISIAGRGFWNLDIWILDH